MFIVIYIPNVFSFWAFPDSKVHGANMGPTWVLSAPDGPHVGPMSLAIKVLAQETINNNAMRIASACSRQQGGTRLQVHNIRHIAVPSIDNNAPPKQSDKDKICNISTQSNWHPHVITSRSQSGICYWSGFDNGKHPTFWSHLSDIVKKSSIQIAS